MLRLALASFTYVTDGRRRNVRLQSSGSANTEKPASSLAVSLDLGDLEHLWRLQQHEDSAFSPHEVLPSCNSTSSRCPWYKHRGATNRPACGRLLALHPYAQDLPAEI